MTRLQLLRFERGLTVSDVAKGSGLSRATVDAAERGANIQAPTVKALADFYDVPVAEILGLDVAA